MHTFVYLSYFYSIQCEDCNNYICWISQVEEGTGTKQPFLNIATLKPCDNFGHVDWENETKRDATKETIEDALCHEQVNSVDSKGGPGWTMLPRFLVASQFLNFPFKFIWLTYTADNFRPAIF